MTQMESGYTPNNLRGLLRKAGLTQRECAERLGVTLRTVQRWCTPIGNPAHSDMPSSTWQHLNRILDNTT